MKCCEIISYTVLWREKLHVYLRKVYPSYSNEYIDYCIDHSSDRLPSLIVINEENDIVGCHLYYCTKAMVCGEVIETQWGHDTFLDKPYRASMGLDLMLATHSNKGFGVGLTDVNEKIQKLLKDVFFKGVFNYYLLTWKVILIPVQLLFKWKPVIKTPEKVRVGKYIFRRVKDANAINIPNDGFWNKDILDIDFIRDSSFINDRFLNNKVHKYYLYTLDIDKDTCYFVVRQTYYRGIPAIALSDYRYTNYRMLNYIMRAVIHIGYISNLGVVVFLSGDDNMDKVVRGRFHYRTKEDFVTNMHLKPTLTYMVTGGDSDADFLK